MSSDKKNPSTGSGRDRDDEKPEATEASGSPESAEEQSTETADATDETIEATPEPDIDDVAVETETLSEEDAALLDLAAVDLVAEMRSDMLRAQAELVNFRQRVERDRQANRDAVISEVIRSLLPALDDLARAEAHGDLVDGAPMTIVAQKLRGAFEKYGLTQVGEKGQPFDPAFHEAVVQLPNPEVTVNTIADVIEPGYVLGDRLVRPAKVAVFVPAE